MSDQGGDIGRAPAGHPDSAEALRSSLLSFLSVACGYLLALVVGLASGWVVPNLLGYGLDRARWTTGPFAADGPLVSSAFDVAFASFPLVFAASVVVIDVLLVRHLSGRNRPNRRGVVGWCLLASSALALLLLPLGPILPPYGFVRLLSAPVYSGLVGVGTVAVAAGIAGLAGASVPIAVCAEGASLTVASRHAVAAVRSAPVTTVAPVGPLLVGWGVGGTLLFGGIAVLGLALGLFVFGLFLLPFVFAIWLLAALAFAAGHIVYRVRTVSNHRHQ